MMFPLPLDFFPPLRLSKQEAQSFLQWGDSLLQQTIDAYHREQFDTQETRERKWKPIKQRRDLTVYRRRKLKDDSDYKYLCTGRIDGTLDEVVVGRYADNTPDFRRISGVYRDDIVDCAVLGVIKKRSPEDPFFLSCFKWMTVESPGKGLVKNRDVCWYEQVGMTRDRNGKEIGYTLTESVELPTCPTFNECVRAKFSICYLYKRNKSGGVKVYMRAKNDAGGKVADWVADIKSAELWLRIEQAMPVAHAVVATALVEAGKHTVRPFITHKKCEVCHAKASGFLSSSKQCAVCHRLTCSSCVAKVRVLSFHDFRVPHHELFCKKCIRLIHQVDLRAPEGVQNLVEYAAASLTGPDSSENSFMSSRGRATSRLTDDSGEGLDEDRFRGKTTSVTSSHSSSGGSFRALPQPQIGMNRQHQEDETHYYTQPGGAAAPLPKHPGQPTHNTYVSSSMPAVTIYDGRVPKKSSRSMDTYVQRRHSRSPPPSPEDNYYRGRDSETPLTRTRSIPSAGPYGGNLNSPVSYERSSIDASTDSLMVQIIKMNLNAEQSRQQIQDNLKLARQLSSTRP
ncbi:hypothetical protein PF005_g16812 [Phytophthora fragariae]|uniref:FYVE-type domain-containing protein n=3 Tax=Phytophthora fragariae TaxID=53985 RepID=A0A6A3SKG3_9STRA|nr:hypothetical protein PF003_g3901 [Phytophthora fragariae]KAE8932636.1 hypothetical protein PF009_g17341 [Phytophthora fragariae]KAE8997124.1 hypothetical protein PF011_g15616 [Phytophthora fragariae]KAE9086813.1 hypothetical protein PF010_g19955 [Phytophthora fragariae]KAE9098819.1 hypothetical protein PF007_g16118 [Phytophthora fragariae]